MNRRIYCGAQRVPVEQLTANISWQPEENDSTISAERMARRSPAQV